MFTKLRFIKRKLFSFYQLNYSGLFHLEREIIAFAAQAHNEALVLDAGSGQAPYKKYFAHTTYENADFQKVECRDGSYAPSTYICDLADIPVENERYDFIICTQVLEHLPEPWKVLSEFFRVLKKGGKIFLSAPLFFEEHEQPYDFYRYTQFAWEKLLADAGFEIQTLDWLEGYYGTLGYQFFMMSKQMPKRFWFFRFFAKFYACYFHYLDTKKKLKTGMPINYFCIATKS